MVLSCAESLHHCPSYLVAFQVVPFYGIDLFHAADNMCKDSGISILAKSLFASLPHWTPQKPVVAQLQNDDFVTKWGSDFLNCENFQGNFHEFHKAFNSHSHSHIKIGLNTL